MRDKNKPAEKKNTHRLLLLTAREVARRLSLGRATVYVMIATGELPSFRKGRAVRVPARALERWIEERTLQARS